MVVVAYSGWVLARVLGVQSLVQNCSPGWRGVTKEKRWQKDRLSEGVVGKN